MKALTMIFSAFFIAGVASAGEQHGGQHGKPSNSSGAFSAAGAVAGSTAISGATGGQGGTGGNSSSSGGSATATGGSVSVTTAGSGSGLTGRMVPDVSTTAPITSTSCRNGISAGGSGNGWGGLIGFFSEDELCEWRLLEANYRATGNQAEADAIRTGMTRQRCAKLSPEERENFGALCPKAPAKETPSPAFLSAG
jgi:hypothetical protein